MNLMNNLKKFTFVTFTSILLSLIINILIAEIPDFQTSAQAQTEIKAQNIQPREKEFLTKQKNINNLAYFQGDKWNVAIPIASLGVFSTILGMITMMLVESRLKN